MRDEYSSNNQFGPYQGNGNHWWDRFRFDATPKVSTAFDYLEDYSKVFNTFSASTAQPNPFSNKVMFIINELTHMKVKYSVDIFPFEGFYRPTNFKPKFDPNEHKLVNIIVEPNPGAQGPAILFVAHHDVQNVRSENCADNGASVCHLLALTSMIKNAQEESKRIIILFTDAEENGARGANNFAKKAKKNKDNPELITHEIYGDISAVINLELTGRGKEIWSDCEKDNKSEQELHKILETVFTKKIYQLKTPPSDAIAFRHYKYPVLCIGTLPKDDLKAKDTWRLCHSMRDTIGLCVKEDMKEFTEFLFKITKITIAENGVNQPTSEAQEPVQT